MAKRPPDPIPQQPIEPELPPVPPDDVRPMISELTVEAATLALAAAKWTRCALSY